MHARKLIVLIGVMVDVFAAMVAAQGTTTQTVTMRGRDQSVRVYGTAVGDPVIVSSGDGGWVHLAPYVTQLLARKGFFLIGFDTKAYLASFTSSGSTLRLEDEPGDYRLLAAVAQQATSKKPILIGVSEGAGLSVLAATDPTTRSVIAGVIGLGLPDVNELGWRWRDSVIYLTHQVPREPTFSTAAIVGRMAPLPLAVIQSTHDEFVAPGEAERVLSHATGPTRLWMVNASNHRFSDNQAELDRVLLEAITWIRQQNPH